MLRYRILARLGLEYFVALYTEYSGFLLSQKSEAICSPSEMAVLETLQSQSQVRWCSYPQGFAPSKVPQAKPNTWVKLLTLLNPYCYDEALLLCPKSDTEWVAWIPDHGEAILHVNHFCLQYS